MKKTILSIITLLFSLLFFATASADMTPIQELKKAQQGGTYKNLATKGGAAKSTAASPTTSGGIFDPPISPTTIEGVLANIMGYLQGIAGTIAVIFIIIGGIMYMVSGGSKEMTEKAKKTVLFAVVGLAIVLAAPLFYQEIKAILSGNNHGSALQAILMNVLKLLLSIVGFLAIITVVIGAIWMFSAVGDDNRYKIGKKTVTYSILGLIIAVASLIIATQVTSLIGNSSSGSSTTTIPSSSPSLPGVIGI